MYSYVLFGILIFLGILIFIFFIIFCFIKSSSKVLPEPIKEEETEKLVVDNDYVPPFKNFVHSKPIPIPKPKKTTH
jgi:hypothetical protein